MQTDAAAAGVAVVGRADGVGRGLLAPEAGRVWIVWRFQRVPQNLCARIGKAAVVVGVLYRTALRKQHAAGGIEGDGGDGKRLLSLDRDLTSRIIQKSAAVQPHRPDFRSLRHGIIEASIMDGERVDPSSGLCEPPRRGIVSLEVVARDVEPAAIV